MGQGVLLDLAGDFERRGQRLRMVGKERRHLLGRLQVLLKRITHAVRVVQIAARVEADQMVVRRGVLGQDEVHVVRTDVLHPVFGGQVEQRAVHTHLVGIDILVLLRIARAVELHFEVVILAEHPLEPLDHAFGLLHVVAHDGLGQLAAQAGRAADEPFVVLLEELFVHARLVVETLGEGVGDHLAEVVIPLQVLGQQNEVVAGLLVLVLLETVAHDVDFAAEDGLDAQIDGRVVEVLHPVHVAVVGDGQRGHAELLGPFEQGLDRGGSVEDGVLGMYVQMDEFRHFRCSVCKSRTKIRQFAGKFPAARLHFINKMRNFIVST